MPDSKQQGEGRGERKGQRLLREGRKSEATQGRRGR